MTSKILVADDERVVTEVVERYLRLQNNEVSLASDGFQALETARDWHPDLVVLDLMLPGMDGLEVCRNIRRESVMPIIMLTAKGEETDRIVGLELGADDYMVRPFSPRELVARIKSVLRRSQTGPLPALGGVIRFDDCRIDPASRSVVTANGPVQLTGKEFDLLFFLASNPGQVFSREQLMDQVWDFTYAGDISTVTVHIRRLRKKFEADPVKPRYIKTVWGVGYKFEN